MNDPKMIAHDCPVEGQMMIESGKPCNWCDSLDDVAPTPFPDEPMVMFKLADYERVERELAYMDGQRLKAIDRAEKAEAAVVDLTKNRDRLISEMNHYREHWEKTESALAEKDAEIAKRRLKK